MTFSFSLTITRRKAVLLLAAVAALIFIATVAGCSQKAREQFRDAPVSSRDAGAAEVYDDPDGFSNFSEKCDFHGNRVIVAFHGDSPYAAVAAIPDDPSCAALKR